MHTNNVECVYPGICHLGEGPIWNNSTQQLYWTDIFQKRIWVYDPSKQQSQVFWEGELQVGGFAFTRAGGMLLCTDRGVYLLSSEALNQRMPEDVRRAVPRIVFDIPMAPDEMFNDITVDPLGRVYAGTLNRKMMTGTLYRLEKGKDPQPIITGVKCSNGMSFSMDESFFFHTDSARYTITRYRYDRNTGEISSPSIFYQGDEAHGLPDGMTVDTQDHVWAAFWSASVVRRLSPAGKIVAEIPIPAKQPSSVMFGGADLSDLYITTACESAVDISKGYDEHGVFLGGPLFRVHTQVKGRAEWLADFE
jgi:sugar lactone lactonase YvrE